MVNVRQKVFKAKLFPTNHIRKETIVVIPIIVRIFIVASTTVTTAAAAQQLEKGVIRSMNSLRGISTSAGAGEGAIKI